MSKALRDRLFDALHAQTLIDPHSHINPHAPASESLADILGYHYYTELAHSAGMPKAVIEGEPLEPKEKVGRLVEHLPPLDNTIQYSWFIEMAQTFFGFEEERLTVENWESLYDRSLEKMNQPTWEEEVLKLSGLEAIFLTNDFDDPLEGFDTKRYIPCLRTDDLVFHLDQASVLDRLQTATNLTVTDATSFEAAIKVLFERFTQKGARACAISLPPTFSPIAKSQLTADPISRLISTAEPSPEEKEEAARYVFWTLAEHCREYRLPFDLMIGVNRKVYPAGVFQGQDLYDSRVSLIQYRELFNAFPEVTFPISVLASVTNQELVSYSWIFPNVVTNGHWWYSNTPNVIERDLSHRLEAVPRTKQIGYYSDMYKLEFAYPKFNMYKRCLAKVLSEQFVIAQSWSEERAVQLGKQVLRGNVERIFPASR
ncbi:Uronate isomerase [Planctomycetales bacterium 10988]|nr:Uronate isomerase [Planctomycetales bacterium 10988]